MKVYLLLHSESDGECRQRVIAVENLIKSYEQFKLQEHHQENQMEEVQKHVSRESNLLENASINEECVEFYKYVHSEMSTHLSQLYQVEAFACKLGLLMLQPSL